MNDKNMPPEIKAAAQYLEQERHFACIKDEESYGFGNRLILFDGPSNIQARLVRDRSQWFIEIARRHADEEGAWHDMPGIRRSVEKRMGLEAHTAAMPMTDGEQAAFLQEHLSFIDALFDERRHRETESVLEQILKEERS